MNGNICCTFLTSKDLKLQNLKAKLLGTTKRKLTINKLICVIASLRNKKLNKISVKDCCPRLQIKT